MQDGACGQLQANDRARRQLQPHDGARLQLQAPQPTWPPLLLAIAVPACMQVHRLGTADRAGEPCSLPSCSACGRARRHRLACWQEWKQPAALGRLPSVGLLREDGLVAPNPCWLGGAVINVV